MTVSAARETNISPLHWSDWTSVAVGTWSYEGVGCGKEMRDCLAVLYRVRFQWRSRTVSTARISPNGVLMKLGKNRPDPTSGVLQIPPTRCAPRVFRRSGRERRLGCGYTRENFGEAIFGNRWKRTPPPAVRLKSNDDRVPFISFDSS